MRCCTRGQGAAPKLITPYTGGKLFLQNCPGDKLKKEGNCRKAPEPGETGMAPADNTLKNKCAENSRGFETVLYSTASVFEPVSNRLHKNTRNYPEVPDASAGIPLCIGFPDTALVDESTACILVFIHPHCCRLWIFRPMNYKEEKETIRELLHRIESVLNSPGVKEDLSEKENSTQIYLKKYGLL